MNLELFHEAERIFHMILDLPPSQRSQALREACGQDDELEELVRELVDADMEDSLQWRPVVAPEPAPRPVLRVGDQVEKYVLVERLGAGGMAEVWVVRHTMLETVYALKVLTLTEPSLLERLLREGRAQARLQHPNILPVRDVLELGGVPALLMPLIDGPTLAGAMASRRLLFGEVCALAEGIAAGLESVHAAGMVHRDLKPANILIDLQSDVPVPRIADFGLVTPTQSDHVDELQTHRGVFMGTPAYASPEQIRDAASVSAASDVYSFGLILFEMLTGTLPFTNVPLDRLHESRLRPIDFSAVPPAQRSLLEGLLQPAPHARPTCADILPVLRSWASFSTAEQHRLYADLRALKPHRMHPDSERPEPKSAARKTNNLPATREPLLGREDALRAVRAAIEDGLRVLTLTGPGGVGKSRLALECAQQQLEEGAGAWPGGVWFCELSDVKDQSSVLAVIVDALGLKLGQETQQGLSLELQGRGRCLLVLDGIEHIAAEVAHLIDSWFDGTEAVFLNTSQHPLHIRAEERIVLSPLPPARGVEMFIACAQEANPALQLGRDQPDLVELVEKLDGLPLAISLAAARARVLPPQRMLKRLSQRFKLLQTRERGLPERQRSLHATIQRSWALLRPWEQDTLAQCSVFEGGFTLEAAEAVIQLDAHDDPPWVEDILGDLIEKSMLSGHPGADPNLLRLSMLASVRDFARQQLQDPRDAAQQHGAFFAELASSILEGDNAQLLEEQHNLRVAHRRAAERGDHSVERLTAQALSLLRDDPVVG